MDTEKNLMFSLNTDEDGYISQECPACERRFKIKPGTGSDKPISFCSYCGYEGRDCWWTKEQVDYLGKAVLQKTIEPEFEKMAKEINRSSKKGDFISMRMDFKSSPRAVPPEELSEDWPKMLFECCGEKIKHDQSQKALFCIICGKEKECALD